MKKQIFTILIGLCFAQLSQAQWSTDSISTPTFGLASTQLGSKAIFASGSKYETYDFQTASWAIKTMPMARANVKAASGGSKSYFAGGGFIGLYSYKFFNNVDIYNHATNAWSTTTVSQARIIGASAAVGNKILFAGGRVILNYCNRVDIFDVTTGVRTTAALSQARTAMAVGMAGNKVVFAGGETGNISNGVYTCSNKADIYDSQTGLWSNVLLSAKREQISSGVVGNKILFAGGIGPNGIYSNKVDIYDASTNTWSVATMSQTKFGMSVATFGDKVYFVGGSTDNSGALSNRVEIYNASTNTWSYTTISSGRMSMSVGQTANRIMFAGGVVSWGNSGSDRVEVFTPATNTWTVENLSQPRFGMASVSYGNKAMFVGGAEFWSSYPQYSKISKRVDVWTDPVARMAVSASESGSLQIDPLSSKPSFRVFPNPGDGRFTIVSPLSTNEFTRIEIMDVQGKVVYSEKIQAWANEEKHDFDLRNELHKGVYFLRINQQEPKRLIIEK